MTWFSSGLSNLKEQIHSLINDDDEDDVKHNENGAEVASTTVDGEKETRRRPKALENDEIQNEKLNEKWHLSPPPNALALPFDYHRGRVIKYSKTLHNLMSDVTFLSSSLSNVADDIDRLFDDENDCRSLREKVMRDGVRDDHAATVTATADVISRSGIDNDDDNDNKNTKTGDRTMNDESDETRSPPTSSSRQAECNEKPRSNKETQTAAAAKANETTNAAKEQLDNSEASEKQIENLIIEIDEITEKLSEIEEKWRKKADADSKAMQADSLTEYTTLAQRRGLLWEKVKVSFVWPTIAKYKNAKISELSVPDSIKEVFQPGFLARQCSDETVSSAGEQQQDRQRQVETNQEALAAIVTTVAENLDDEPAKVQLSMTTTTSTSSSPSPEKNFPVVIENQMLPNKSEHQHQLESQISNANTNANVAAVVEVERLRKHLLSVEQAYTNELLQCEEEIQILRGELKNKEDKLNSITEAYTCANLSTNKTIEQLQLEVKQLAEDKTQLTTQLQRCKNDLEKSQADTRNLRSALDLFRKNKDSEILQATEKLETRIRALQNDNEHLRADVDSLQRLTEKNEFLNQQLHEKKNEIDALKMKLDELSPPPRNDENDGKQTKKKQSSIMDGTWPDTEAKIKFNLIKNIVFTFIASDSPTTKMQSLRILADVLEFSHYEKTKIGIMSQQQQHQQTSEKAANNQSLIDEFIRFVEKESHPQIVQARKHQQQHEREQEQEKLQTTRPPVAALPLDDEILVTTTILPSAGGLACSSSSTILKDALNSKDI